MIVFWHCRTAGIGFILGEPRDEFSQHETESHMSKPTNRRPKKSETRKEIIAKISAENRAYFEALDGESETNPLRKKANSNGVSLSAIVVALILIAGFVSVISIALYEIDDWKHPYRALSEQSSIQDKPAINPRANEPINSPVAAQTQGVNDTSAADSKPMALWRYKNFNEAQKEAFCNQIASQTGSSAQQVRDNFDAMVQMDAENKNDK